VSEVDYIEFSLAVKHTLFYSSTLRTTTIFCEFHPHQSNIIHDHPHIHIYCTYIPFPPAYFVPPTSVQNTHQIRTGTTPRRTRHPLSHYENQRKNNPPPILSRHHAPHHPHLPHPHRPPTLQSRFFPLPPSSRIGRRTGRYARCRE